MLWVRVHNQWRQVERVLRHPTGDRYVLVEVPGQPSTILVKIVDRTPWRSGTSKPRVAG